MNYSGYVTVITEPPVPDRVYVHHGKASMILGATELITALIVTILFIAASVQIGQESGGSRLLTMSIAGIFILAVPALLTGCFAIAGGKTKGICLILTAMVFAILNALGVAPYLISYGSLLVDAGRSVDENNTLYDSSMDRVVTVDENTSIALIIIGSIVLFIGVIQLIVTILIAAYACHGICCCRPRQTSVLPTTPCADPRADPFYR